MHQKHDSIFKLGMCEQNIAKSAIKSYLPKAVVDQVQLSTLTLCTGSFLDDKGAASFADVLYSAKFKDGTLGYLYFLWEHQSSFDKQMPLRFLKYKINIMQMHLHQGHSHLPVIIPTLVYNGKQSPYPGSNDFFDYFEHPKLAREYWMRPFNCVDLTVLSDREIIKRQDSQIPFLSLKHMRDDDFGSIIKQIAQFLKTHRDKYPESFIISLTTVIIKSTQIKDFDQTIQSIKQISDDIGDFMQTTAQTLINQGMQQGLQKGMQQGIQKGMLQVAVNMLKKNMSVESIVECTGLLPEDVQVMADELLV